jgi:toxin ParE1/3/4
VRKAKVGLRPRARPDLLQLYNYIAGQARPRRAAAYIGRIETACRGLERFPERGARRDDLGPGLRALGFEGRVTIIFRVNDSVVSIIRIFYGGRDIESAFGDAASFTRD